MSSPSSVFVILLERTLQPQQLLPRLKCRLKRRLKFKEDKKSQASNPQENQITRKVVQDSKAMIINILKFQ